jgi:hypothetical protein
LRTLHGAVRFEELGPTILFLRARLFTLQRGVFRPFGEDLRGGKLIISQR